MGNRHNYRVLFLTATLEVGGSETKIVKIANAMAEAGYATEIAYLNAPETLLEKVSPAVPVTHLERRGKYSFSSVAKLRRLIGAVPTIIFGVNYYPLLYALPATRGATRASAKIVGLINTTDFVEGQRLLGYAYAPFLRRCDSLVFGCRYQRNYWIEKYRLPAERSSYIYNGVDGDYFSPDKWSSQRDAARKQFGIPRDAIVIGGIGRLAPEKNFDLLVESIGKLRASGRDAHLLLVGDGRERRALQAFAETHGLSDKLTLPGVLADIRPALAAMDVFVLPSRAVETFSNAALEAMSMARPVVLSNIGGAAEMIEPGQSGYLFGAGDGEALLGVLIDLFDSARERERLGKAARQRIVRRFGFETMLNAYRLLVDSM